jgi:hypothetical protein
VDFSEYSIEHCERILGTDPKACWLFAEKVRKWVMAEEVRMSRARSAVRRALECGPMAAREILKFDRSQPNAFLDLPMLNLALHNMAKAGEAESEDGVWRLATSAISATVTAATAPTVIAPPKLQPKLQKVNEVPSPADAILPPLVDPRLAMRIGLQTRGEVEPPQAEAPRLVPPRNGGRLWQEELDAALPLSAGQECAVAIPHGMSASRYANNLRSWLSASKQTGYWRWSVALRGRARSR